MFYGLTSEKGHIFRLESRQTHAFTTHITTRCGGTNKLSHICPYLEIRTVKAGGVFVFNYVAALCLCALCPPDGGRESPRHRPSVVKPKPDQAECVKLAGLIITRPEAG